MHRRKTSVHFLVHDLLAGETKLNMKHAIDHVVFNLPYELHLR